MGRARGVNALMNLAFETTYGVPPASGYLRMPFVSAQLGATQGLIESDLLGQLRAPADPTYDVVANDGDIVVPLDTIRLGHWLKLLFGAPITTSSGTSLHAFRSGAQTLPSASIEIGHPDRPSYSTHYGIRANTFAVQMQRSGLASATIGLIGKGETVLGLTSTAGDPVLPGTVERYAPASGSISIDGVAVGEVLTANFAFSNGLDKNETIAADGEITDVDPGMPTASLAMTAKFADMTLLNKATAKTPANVKLAWKSGTNTLEIVMPRVFLPRVKRPISGPGGIQVDFNAVASTPEGDTMVYVGLRNSANAGTYS